MLVTLNMSGERKSSQRAGETGDNTNSKNQSVVLDLTLGSDEEESKIGDNKESVQKRRPGHSKTKRGDSAEGHGRLRHGATDPKPVEQEKTEDEYVSLSQTDKIKIRNALKNGRLQQLVPATAKEDARSENSAGSSMLKLLGSALDKDPNDTDDFSGGATPYRIVINKNLQKRQQLKKESKATKVNLKKKKMKGTEARPSSSKDVTADNSSRCEKSEVEGIGNTGNTNSIYRWLLPPAYTGR